MQNKGIVMQLDELHAIVMTHDCQFRKIPRLADMEVGGEVELPPASPQTVTKRPRSWWASSWKRSGVLAASVLLAAGIWGSQALLSNQQAQACAYVTVDINPSVELSLDNQQKVIAVTPLNDDAAQVLGNVKLQGLPVKEAVTSLTQAARTQGFFQDKTEVIITASPAVADQVLQKDHIDLTKLEDDLVAQVKSTTGSSNIDVEGVLVSKDVREAAKQAGLSPGKYALFLAAQSNGIDVSVNDLQQKSVTKIVDQRGKQLAEVLHTLPGGDKLDQLLDTYKKDGKFSVPANEDKGVLPDQSSNGQSKNDSKPLPPGLAKKEDGKQNPSGKKGDQWVTDGVPGSPDLVKPADREHGSQGHGNGNGNGKGKSDGDDHAGNSQSNNGQDKQKDKDHGNGHQSQNESKDHGNGQDKGRDKGQPKKESFVNEFKHWLW